MIVGKCLIKNLSICSCSVETYLFSIFCILSLAKLGYHEHIMHHFYGLSVYLILFEATIQQLLDFLEILLALLVSQIKITLPATSIFYELLVIAIKQNFKFSGRFIRQLTLSNNRLLLIFKVKLPVNHCCLNLF
jgi:hypothetical protein